MMDIKIKYFTLSTSNFGGLPELEKQMFYKYLSRVQIRMALNLENFIYNFSISLLIAFVWHVLIFYFYIFIARSIGAYMIRILLGVV